MNILTASMTRREIRRVAEEFNQPPFRGDQLADGTLLGKSLEEMSNLPESFKLQLAAAGFRSRGVEIKKTLVSDKDGTRKFLYGLLDDNVIEGVLMSYKYGDTLCVSTQVGCRMGCAFCASTLGGLVRNLEAGEILGQVIAAEAYEREVRKDAVKGARYITNIVLMGSGEPLDNYDDVARFLELVSSADGLNISKRNVSLSTCGLCERIRRLADDGFSPVLTISLHAPFDDMRANIMPIAKRYRIAEILDAARYYFDKTGRRVIYEYALIDGLNDGEDCVKKLASLLKGSACHVNVIPLNSVKERNLVGSGRAKAVRFEAALKALGISCSVRRTMGEDIEGACGQLRRAHIDGEQNE